MFSILLKEANRFSHASIVYRDVLKEKLSRTVKEERETWWRDRREASSLGDRGACIPGTRSQKTAQKLGSYEWRAVRTSVTWQLRWKLIVIFTLGWNYQGAFRSMHLKLRTEYSFPKVCLGFRCFIPLFSAFQIQESKMKTTLLSGRVGDDRQDEHSAVCYGTKQNTRRKDTVWWTSGPLHF